MYKFYNYIERKEMTRSNIQLWSVRFNYERNRSLCHNFNERHRNKGSVISILYIIIYNIRISS